MATFLENMTCMRMRYLFYKDLGKTNGVLCF